MHARKLPRTLLTALALAALATSVAIAAPGRGLHRGRHVKNVIVMISDGWGINHIKATNYYEGVSKQVYERFPVRSYMSTYMDGGSYDPAQMWSDFDYAKSGYTDSAAAATAMSCGVKTYDGAIGVDVNGEPVMHMMERAEQLGLATGVVTSVEFSHATPAGFVAHNASRNNYIEIANEMIYDSATDVIMGCGNPDYNNDGVYNPGGQNDKYVGGPATWADVSDGSVLGADADGDGNPDEWHCIFSRAQFQALMSGDAPDRVLGIPHVYQTLQQSRGGDPYADPYDVPLIDSVPTLEEMTVAALNVLDNDEDGLVLMVEGGAVDWASHSNQSGRMIEEQIDFNNAVEAVCEWVRENSNWRETVLIVTGDHECGYLWGPGSDPTFEPIVDCGAGNLPGMEWHSGSHTNQIVPIYARGVAANLLRLAADGSDPVRGRYMDNTDIARLGFFLLR